MANIKYIGKDASKSETGKIHIRKGTHTACGARIDDNPEDWQSTGEAVTCQKYGCKQG